MMARNGIVPLTRYLSILGLLFFLGAVGHAQPPDAKVRRLRIFSVRGWNLNVNFDVAGSLEQLLKDDPEHVRIARIDYEVLFFSDGHYLLNAPKNIKKERLPVSDSLAVSSRSVDILECEQSILLSESATDYPILDKLLRYAHDRTDSEAYVPSLQKRTARLAAFKSATGEDIHTLIVGSSTIGGGWVPTIASRYDLIVNNKPVRATIIGKVFGGYSRVKPALDRRLHEIKDPAILLNLGELATGIDLGPSQDGMLKRMLDSGLRLVSFDAEDIEHAWDSLIHYAQTGPQERRAVLLASNLQPIDASTASIVNRTYVETVDEVRIGFISLLPLSANAILARKNLAWVVKEPAIAAREAVEELRDKERVDVVILISHLNSEEDAHVLAEVPGIDIHLGAAAGEFGTRRHTVVDLTDWSQERHRRPALWSLPSYFTYGEVALEFRSAEAGYELTRVEEIPGPVGSDLPVDKDLEATEEKLFGYFGAKVESVLPDPRALWPQARKPKLVYEAPEFWNLAAQILRRQTGAEIALLRLRRLGNNMPGEAAESFVSTWLIPRDRLVRLKLNGRALRTLMPRIAYLGFPLLGYRDDRKFGFETWLAQAGLNSKGFVHGMPLRDEEIYSVVTTEEVLKHADELPALKAAMDVRSEDITVDQVVLVWLKDRRRRADEDGNRLFGGRVRGDMGDGPEVSARSCYVDDIRNMAEGITPERPVWRLDLRELSGQFANTQIENTGPFTQVPDARIQSVSQVQGQGVGRLFSEFYWRRWRWDVGATGQYGEVIVKPPGVPRIENKVQDRFVVETEFRHRTFRFERGWTGLSLGPYLNASYDTQFTPTPTRGVPFRRYVWMKPGVKLFEGTWLRDMHVAAVSQTDYAAPRSKTDFGFEAGYTAAHN